ncbi:MAG: nucleotidyltransferase family protein [Clostridia bacterium]|nr:nucleotidyltransferase family protein [Clostridia bacterium]
MKCLILAAGYATRLYPLTENFPKPLLKVGSKTILDWLTDDIRATGAVDGFVVISNGKFAAHFEEWAAAFNDIEVVNDGTFTNETRLGAVKDIVFAKEKLGIDDDLLVIAGDNVLDFSLSHFIDFCREKKTSCTMRYYEPSIEKLRKCGVLTVGDDGRILRMAEKPAEPESHFCCPPFYYYTAADSALLGDAIADGCGTDAPGSLVAWMSAHRPVYSMEMPGSRYDIGNLESYKKVCGEYKGITR